MKAFVLAAFLFGANAPAYAPDNPFDMVWQDTCEQVVEINEMFTCEGLARPYVVITQLVGHAGYNGVYFPGERMIFVDPDTTSGILPTVQHEMVHYILTFTAPFLDKEVCFHEEVARFVAGQPWEAEHKEKYQCD